MRRLIFGVMAGMILPLYSAHASIASDITENKPIAEVIQNAGEISLTDLMAQIAAANPELLADAVAAIISADPTKADAAVDAATKADPTQAAAIVSAAAGAGANLEQMQQVAIAADPTVDPVAVGEATAAGNGNAQGQRRGLTIAPGQTGRRVNPPPFGNNGGGGGGGTGSQS